MGEAYPVSILRHEQSIQVRLAQYLDQMTGTHLPLHAIQSHVSLIVLVLYTATVQLRFWLFGASDVYCEASFKTHFENKTSLLRNLINLKKHHFLDSVFHILI